MNNNRFISLIVYYSKYIFGENNWIIDKDIPIFKGEGREYIERFVNVGEE